MRVLALALLIGACTKPADADADGAGPGSAGPQRALQVEAGTYSACARFDDGSVQCWGRCGAACGRRDAESSTEMAAIAGVRDAIDLTVGEDFACVVHRGGTVSCWGSNFYGALGVAGPRFVAMPAVVAGIGGVAEIDASRNMMCARTEAGELWTWGGAPEADPPPPASSRVPTRLATTERATALFSAGNGCCARTSSDRFACWREGSSELAVSPSRFGDACGCTLDAGGTLHCESYALPGPAMADGTVPDSPPLPCSIDALAGVEDFVISDDGGWALRHGGELWAWGNIVVNEGTKPLARIEGVPELTMLAAGTRGAIYGVDEAGSLWGWGQSYEHGITAADQKVPTPLRMWPRP